MMKVRKWRERKGTKRSVWDWETVSVSVFHNSNGNLLLLPSRWVFLCLVKNSYINRRAHSPSTYVATALYTNTSLRNNEVHRVKLSVFVGFFLSGQRRTAGGGSERNETWRAAPHTPALVALRLCEFFVMAGMKFSFFVIYCVNILLQASYFLFFFCCRRKAIRGHEIHGYVYTTRTSSHDDTQKSCLMSFSQLKCCAHDVVGEN